MLPFKGRNRVTSIYGTRNGVFHKGIDIVGDDNKTVLAVSGGKVVTSTIVTNKSDKTREWGNYVRVDLPDGTRHYYCHLASRAVRAGQTLEEGDTIGVMGNTGYSFGAHLHFEVRTKANIDFNPATTLSIPNAVGTYTATNTNRNGDDDMKMGIYAPTNKTVSSQLLKEGAFAIMQEGNLKLYERRMVREIDNNSLSLQFEAMKSEMQNNELIVVTEN